MCANRQTHVHVRLSVLVRPVFPTLSAAQVVAVCCPPRRASRPWRLARCTRKEYAAVLSAEALRTCAIVRGLPRQRRVFALRKVAVRLHPRKVLENLQDLCVLIGIHILRGMIDDRLVGELSL